MKEEDKDLTDFVNELFKNARVLDKGEYKTLPEANFRTTRPSKEELPKGIQNDIYKIDEMSEEQLDAIYNIVSWLWDVSEGKATQNFRRLIGKAGTGKTIVLTYILTYKDILLPFEILRREIAVATYTWKAALVLKQRGIGSACSVHSIFYRPYENSNSGVSFVKRQPQEISDFYSMVIIDEASMIGKSMREDLESIGIPILYVGDSGQLPPIGDVKNSDGKYFLDDAEDQLNEVRRQALDNPIIALSLYVRENGKLPPKNNFDGKGKVFFVDKDQISDKMLLHCDQIIVGTNKTRNFLNNKVRQLKGYETNTPLRKGEKIIGLSNIPTKQVYNGQQWIIDEDIDAPINNMSNNMIFLQNELTSTNVFCVFENDLFLNQFEKAQQLAIARQRDLYLIDFGYAITCHKSQGSAFNKVILYAEKLGFMSKEDYTKWLYTGITRAIDKIIIVT